MEQFEPVIVAFCCHYCAYAAADLAGSMRLEYPTSIKVIELPCSGKLDVGVTENERIAFNAGSLTDSMIISRERYIEIDELELEGLPKLPNRDRILGVFRDEHDFHLAGLIGRKVEGLLLGLERLGPEDQLVRTRRQLLANRSATDALSVDEHLGGRNGADLEH